MNAPTLAPPAAVVDATVWQHAVETFDIDEFAGAQPEWTLRYEQLSSGRFAGRLQHVQLPGVRLVIEQTNCAARQRGRLGDGHIGIAMPLELGGGHATFNGQPLASDSIMIGRSEDLDLCLPAGAAMIAIVVEARLLGTLWEHMYGKPLSAWIDHQLVVQPRHGAAAELRRLHLAALADGAEPALLRNAQAVTQLRDAILMEWIEALPARVDTDELASAQARKRVVDRACELMLARPDEPMTVLQVCDRIGASPRKLEYCFRHVLGISPARWLRAARLNGVRRELLREPLAVQDGAARWGFWHMGEFAAAYRRQFGELPSQTVRQRG